MKITKHKIEKLVTFTQACAREICSEEVQSGDSIRDFDLAREGLEWIEERRFDRRSTLESRSRFRNLQRFLSSLSDTERREILTLILVGSGARAAKEFSSAFESAWVGRDRDDDLCFVAVNIVGTNDLVEGFEKLNRARML